MSECPALDMQDQLPDYVAERLHGDGMGAVQAHLASCAACRHDVAVLRRVRSVGVAVPVIDPARIAAAVVARTSPDAPATVVRERPVQRPLGVEPTKVQTLPSSMTRSAWRRVRRWQMAAALTLVVTGAMSTMMARRGEVAVSPVAEVDSVPAIVATSAGSGASVSYGDLTDYSEGELESMLATLEGWDGAARAEPASFDPVVVPVGGPR